MAEPWLTRDYTAWWRLPPPLPPARWPRVLFWLIAVEIAVSLGAGLPTPTGDRGEVRRQIIANAE
jgi:hypothetical protein